MPMMKTEPAAPSASLDWIERTAIAASFACAAHCLALPLLIALLPSLFATLHVPESFHVAMLVLAVPAASVALVQGWMQHAARAPLAIGGSGVVLLGLAILLGGVAETLVTVTGSTLLAWAHVRNWRLRRGARV